MVSIQCWWYHHHSGVSRNPPLQSNFVVLTTLIVGILLFVRPVPYEVRGNDETYEPPENAVVFQVQDPSAVEAFTSRPNRIRDMVDRGVKALTGKPTVEEAWRSLVSTQDVVGLKVYSQPGPNSGTRPAVVAGVIEGLLAAGLPATNIIVWDKNLSSLRLANYFKLRDKFGVRIAGSFQSGYDRETSYENPVLGNLVWGDVEFGQTGDVLGRKSYVSTLVSKEITRHINIAPLLNHTVAGVSGILLSLALGSVDNTARFEGHRERMAVAIPEIYALPALSDRVALSIVDALICQYEGGETSKLHRSVTLNELRFSLDPVALDVLSIQELEHQRKMAGSPIYKPNYELYTNAALLELGVADTNKIRIVKVP
jgi:Domain of unknown function (DUF362)